MTVVLIVPPESTRGTAYQLAYRWGHQFVDADPDNRVLITLSDETPQAVLDATRAAIAAAGRDGEVVYFVGHGGASDTGQAAVGVAHFAPHGRFRVDSFVAYQDDNTGTWRGPSIAQLQRETETFSALPRGRGRRRAEQAWCGRHWEEGCQDALRGVLAMSDVQPHWMALRQLHHDNPVRRITLMTCNVGNALDFLDEIATDLGVPVRALRRGLDSHHDRATNRVRVYLRGDVRGYGTNVPEAETEIWPNIPDTDYEVGRVGPRHGRSRVGGLEGLNNLMPPGL